MAILTILNENTPNDQTINVGTSSVELSPEKTVLQRKVLIITNISSGNQVITLGIGTEAVANKGIILQPNAIYQESMDSGYIPTNMRITAVCSGTTGQVSLHERTLPLEVY
jgi:hypothetical protein